MAVIILGGMPGVGKSTVLKEALKSVGVEPGFVNFADVMLEFMGGGDHDALRRLPFVEQRELQIKAAKKIAKMGKGKGLVVDTHYIVKTPNGFLPGLPFDVVRELNPRVFVFVECPAKELIKRRAGDKTRKRDVEGEKEVEAVRDMNLNFIAAYSAMTRGLVKVIENRDGKLKEAGKELADVLNSL